MSQKYPFKKPEVETPADEPVALSTTAIPAFQPPTMTASEVEVEFIENHTHAGKNFVPGDRLMVPKLIADWLITHKRAKIA